MHALEIRRHLGRKWWRYALLLGWVVVLQFLALACATRVHADQSTNAAPAMTVPFFQIKAQNSFSSARRYAGTLVAARAADLGFKRGGEVEAIHVDLGDAVVAGDVLARLDDRMLRAEEQRAAADLVLARANLVATQADAQLAANTERRTRSLREKGHVSKQSYDETQLSLRAQLAQVDVAKANVRRAGATLEAARVALAEAQIVAPFSGRIQARYVDEGSQLASGRPLLKLVEDSEMEVHVGLPAATAQNLSIGQSYAVMIQDRIQYLPLRTVLPEVDPATRTVKAVFQLDTSKSRAVAYAVGSVVELEYDELVSSDGFWVPLTALTAADRGLWSVFVVNDDNLIERRLLEVIHTEAERVFVRGTLSEADRVVQTGVQRIVPGQSVIPVPAMQAGLASNKARGEG
ncbi:MAG: efflux RND transporter periplasmic adaptor subunit [Pseudomonadota bacterium]